MDCISKKVQKNHGEIAQYYVENNHPAIISRDTFQRVQEETARRGSKRSVSDKALTVKGKYSGKYALSELLVCAECGTRYKRVTWARNGKKKIVWRCINRLENGTTYCKTSPTLEETRLHDALLRAMNHILEVKDEVLNGIDEALRDLTEQSGSGFDRLAAQQEIARLENMADGILALARESGDSTHYFDDSITKVYDERAALLEQIREDDKRRASASANSARLQSLMASIRNAPTQIDEYDDDFIREFVDSINVIDADRLTVMFKGGFEIEAEMNG